MGRRVVVSGQTSRYSRNGTTRSAQRYITSQHGLDYLTNKFRLKICSSPLSHVRVSRLSLCLDVCVVVLRSFARCAAALAVGAWRAGDKRGRSGDPCDGPDACRVGVGAVWSERLLCSRAGYGQHGDDQNPLLRSAPSHRTLFPDLPESHGLQSPKVFKNMFAPSRVAHAPWHNICRAPTTMSSHSPSNKETNSNQQKKPNTTLPLAQ